MAHTSLCFLIGPPIADGMRTSKLLLKVGQAGLRWIGSCKRSVSSVFIAFRTWLQPGTGGAGLGARSRTARSSAEARPRRAPGVSPAHWAWQVSQCVTYGLLAPGAGPSGSSAGVGNATLLPGPKNGKSLQVNPSPLAMLAGSAAPAASAFSAQGSVSSCP